MRYLAGMLSISITIAAIPAVALPPTQISESDPARGRAQQADVVEYFTTDPTLDLGNVVEGQALPRLVHRQDAPAFPGDRPGSLEAYYDAGLPAGLFGIPLPRHYDAGTTFTAAATFVIDSGGFAVDPDGFFQISWGLWNRSTTGLNRTGDFANFAGDSFELLEFAYFPNASPFFGGPFVSPSAFGVATPDDPSFPGSGAFANAAFSFGVERSLPLDEPLLAVIEHRPDLNAMTTTVYRIVGRRQALPIPGAVALVPLDAMNVREYTVDTIGLTLWTDGFGGATPAVQATLVFHSLVAAPRLFGRPEDLLRLPPRKP